MGTASEDASRGGSGRATDDLVVTASEPAVAAGDPSRNDRGETTLVPLLATRGRAVVAAVAVAVVAGVAGAGVTAAVLGGGGDAARVVAWLEFGDGNDYPGNDTVGMVLNVVNAGQREVVVADADFDGGLDPGSPASVLAVALDGSIRVAPGDHARQDVQVSVDDCETVRTSGSRDDTLRVGVTDADARSTWITGSEVGAYPVTASVLVQSICEAGSTGPVTTQAMSVGPDGELMVVLRSTAADATTFTIEGPEGIRFTGEPSLPVTVPDNRDGNATVAVRLVVDECTAEIVQLDAAGQVRLVADGQDVFDFDFLLLHSWYVREVTRACG